MCSFQFYYYPTLTKHWVSNLMSHNYNIYVLVFLMSIGNTQPKQNPTPSTVVDVINLLFDVPRYLYYSLSWYISARVQVTALFDLQLSTTEFMLPFCITHIISHPFNCTSAQCLGRSVNKISLRNICSLPTFEVSYKRLPIVGVHLYTLQPTN